MPSKLVKLSPTMAKRLRKRSPRQWNLVKKIRSEGLPVRVYKRAGKVGGNKTNVSVHVPTLDFDRNARVSNRKARKYPQAYDTEAQRFRRFKNLPVKIQSGKKKGKWRKNSWKVLLP